MSTTDQSIEQEIQAKGLTAPRVTPGHIESVIVSEHYFTAFDGALGALANPAEGRRADDACAFDAAMSIPKQLMCLSFCVLVLKNGYTVTGESAVASPENFDAEIGRKVARKNAIDKIWPLEGYLLRERLSAV